MDKPWAKAAAVVALSIVAFGVGFVSRPPIHEPIVAGLLALCFLSVLSLVIRVVWKS
jgi:hypothetical protein